MLRYGAQLRLLVALLLGILSRSEFAASFRWVLSGGLERFGEASAILIATGLLSLDFV